MNTSLHPRSLFGIAAAGLLASAVLSFGSAAATADPLTDLLCNSGSAQFCPQQPVIPPQSQPAPYYKNCDEVRRAGKAPLYRGQPGYASHLDRDNDGIACE